MENKAFCSIEDVVALRKRGGGTDNPMALLAAYTSLRIKKGFTLRDFPDCGFPGIGGVWAVPASSPLPSLEKYEMVHWSKVPYPLFIFEGCEDINAEEGPFIRRPPGALDNVMEAIEGDGTARSYLSASIFAREIAEFGVNSWPSPFWASNIILGRDPWICPHGWKEDGGPSSEQDWHWSDTKPFEWRPLVVQDGEVITVKFHTFSGLKPEAIYCYTDTYKANNYKFEYDVKKIAEGPGGIIE